MSLSGGRPTGTRIPSLVVNTRCVFSTPTETYHLLRIPTRPEIRERCLYGAVSVDVKVARRLRAHDVPLVHVATATHFNGARSVMRILPLSVIMALRDIDGERLMPTKKAYSICQIDTMKPASDSECTVKLYEVSSLDEAEIAPRMGIIWMAYDQSGDGTILKP